MRNFLLAVLIYFSSSKNRSQQHEHLQESRLRSNSRSKSEENIVIDVGKEALSMQGFQEKIQSTFSSIKNVIAGTISSSSESTSENSMKRNFAFSERREDFHDLPTAPEDDFIFTVPKNYLMSPYMAPVEVLRQFPKTNILTTIVDPCIDDCVEFGKKLKSLGVDIKLDILGALNHGFLNFAQVNNFKFLFTFH